MFFSFGGGWWLCCGFIRWVVGLGFGFGVGGFSLFGVWVVCMVVYCFVVLMIV